MDLFPGIFLAFLFIFPIIFSQIWLPELGVVHPNYMRSIQTKIYIDDQLYRSMQAYFGKLNVNDEINAQIQRTFKEVNKLLLKLDKGGYRVEFPGETSKLENSEIKLGQTYIDRRRGNVRRPFDPHDVFAYTFTFQEAVEKLPDRFAVDLRILFIREPIFSATVAASEENCMCNPKWFGCVLVFSIAYLDQWWYDKSIFAHEIGHTLGMDVHDNQVYEANPGNMLLMWQNVSHSAHIWSPESRKRINGHDNSCLRKAQRGEESLSSFLYCKYFYCEYG